jgi:hypothetical protein
MASARGKQLSNSLTQLEREPERLSSGEARALLATALASRDQQAVQQAAKLIAAHTLSEHEQALQQAYRELSGERAGSDPGCLAKEALLQALDALEHTDGELFAGAASYIQLESGKLKGRDSAGRVRARAVLGLARLGHQDLLLILGARLGDDDASVRLSAARALAHRQQRDGAGLLLLKLAVGDTEAEVLVEALRGLFTLAPDFALPCARSLLGRGEEASALALRALGTAASDAAIELLETELATRALASDRREVIDALGLSLRPLARESLLGLLRSGRSSDAEAALAALSIHRYDPRLVEQVREAVSGSRELSGRFAELYTA